MQSLGCRACVRAAARRALSSESPLRRLLRDAGARGEAPGAGELRWATTPYADRAAPPTAAPQDAAVLLFPGQGAQFVGMGRRLQQTPAARDLYDLASSIVGWDVWRVCTAGPAAELERRVQVCVLSTALAALERAREERPGAVERVRAAAGFSLGELGALVFAGALSLDAALRLAQLREAAMRAAAAERAGGMLTVWLAPDARLGALLAAARERARGPELPEPVCEVANYLFPGCKVLAGDERALRAVEAEGRAWGVRRSARVRVVGAFHCALMARAEAAVREALRALPVGAPRVRVVSCVDARSVRGAEGARRRLARLTAAPVRWEQTLHALYARPRGAPQPLTLALGPGGALRATLKLVNARAWDASLQIDV
ncbi:probable malonyl-CoA-acyl carrier protein transacylase, mitochondrial [Maniola hyperantus]|uniref:probable malonyl-CoA-acyl carrier protein transacylase, mitochondrial n=1 Tax=Aphantopus hyperantus TaxID=2795564 RepID=UPI001568CE11|nr:probable malonyl-CoA-acyl carrier protein transacylase, mitochondrial [Maniola hyperantus]